MNPVHRGLQHARAVHEILRNPLTADSHDHVIESWRRCLIENCMAPDKPRQPLLVGRAELNWRREQVAPMLHIAEVEMAGLTRLLNAPVGVMLTDTEGVILHYNGSPEFAAVAQGSGLREGAVWSEAQQGTNGMGTCLAVRRPVLIQESQHFLFQNTALTCCGGPIFDGAGTLMGALNISGRLQLSAAPTMALVQLAVQNIENRILLEQHRQHHVLRFHPHREFIGTASEGILAIDDEGCVAGANHSALNWLGLRDHAQVYQQNIRSVFGLSLDRLQGLSQHPAHAQPLPWRQTGTLCFSILQPPLCEATTTLPAMAINPLRRAEREALRQLLEECQWNVSQAARQLNISRRTLHRKLNAHQLKRYNVDEADRGFS